VRRYLDLASLTLVPSPEPRPLDSNLPLRQVDLTALPPVPDRFSLRSGPARLLRARDTFGAHLQHRLDRCPAHHLDHLVDRELRLLHQLDHR